MATPADTQPTAPRRELAAIMFSDIAGYTAIMGRDEQAAMRALSAHREFLRTLVPKFNGRIIGEIGDGTLSSFHSAVDAVNCAREVQTALTDGPEFSLRIGIHVGDVVFANDTVLGDGVNVASRIHALAPPGGICISERVYDEIRNKPGLPAKFLGEKMLKNVTRPINVYVMALPGGSINRDPESTIARRRMIRRRMAVALVVTVLVALGYAVSHKEIETLARIYIPRLFLPEVNQKIAYTTTRDGVRIAYGTSGKGTPVVIAVGLLTHLKLGLLYRCRVMARLKR
jgi:class 3 adenylate cyclase